jgi:hypothetical protein
MFLIEMFLDISKTVAYGGGEPRGPGLPPWRKIPCRGVRVKKILYHNFY